ncbi:hypothetical protein [Ferrovum sp.]|uniref:hypothetical protein n=1 Tax=Ferrovum sp. TaxID=2609467 RepID=UPI002635D61E|nr:hypothetical protein [Ferrovum sp.]
MGLPTFLEKRQQALEKREELARKFHRKRTKPIKKSVTAEEIPTAIPYSLQLQPPTTPVEHYGQASVPVYRENELVPSVPSPGLTGLVDLYLEAARNKIKHVALVWPAAPRSLAIVHVLATLERWAIGDKQGIRGLIFPAKTNAFHPLNHLYLDREAIRAHAQKLIETRGEENSFLIRKLQEKDSFLFSVASRTDSKSFNPTMSELIPHFFAGQRFEEWGSCSEHLLEHIGPKLKRAHKAALRSNCDILGAPKTAPDALFALDIRMSKDERHAALLALKKIGLPEVILVNATRPVRLPTRGWSNLISHVCMEIDETFGTNAPGILIVTDDPNAAFQIRHKLTEQSAKRTKNPHEKIHKDFRITGICSGIKEDGLLPPGVAELAVPMPREFKLEIVDTESARVINRLYKIAGRLPNGHESGRPVYEAAGYLSRLAALPCGISTLVEWLTQTAASEHARRIYSWATYHAALSEFERSDDAGGERSAIQECLALGAKLYENYHTATPLALRLAKLIEQHAQSGRHPTVIVFTSAICRRLAERFLTQFDYQDGGGFEQFADRVIFTSSSQLEEQLTHFDGDKLIFVGLDDEGLRLAMTDNRVPKHSVVLMTQRSGQFLRAMLNPLKEKFPEFKVLKPRMESFLRQLSGLPDNQTIFLDDFVLPTFRTELHSEASNTCDTADTDTWCIALEDNATLYRKPTHKVYVYDPASSDATDRGFRACEVSSLQSGDKLFVMSSELRELVESVLKEAGVPIEHDKTFEAALRDYHKDVIKSLNRLFQGMKLAEQVRQLRMVILENNEKLASEFPGEQAVRYWVSLGDSADTPFDQLKPRAPMREAHFVAFAETLGFNSLQTAYYWQRVIMAIRNARRLDGRHVSDLYSYMLLQPEAAMLHSKVSQQTLKIMFQNARESIVVVENVISPSGRNTDA